MMRLTIFALAVLVFIPIGLMMLYRGLRGKLQASEPRCAKCKYDIRMTLLEHGLEKARCPECGTMLSDRRAITFARTRKRPVAIVAGLLLLGIPVALIVMVVMRNTMLAGVSRSSARSTSSLIADLATNAGSTQTWIELGNRPVTDAEAQLAIDHLIAFLSQHNQSQRGGLHWVSQTLERWDTGGQIKQAQFQKLCEAWFRSSMITNIASRVRPGIPIRGNINPSYNDDFSGSQVVYALREARLGNTPLPIQQEYSETTDPDRFSQREHGSVSFILPNALSPGDYNLELEIDFGVLPANTPMTAVDGLPGQKRRWLNPRATWTVTVTQPVKVVAEGQYAVDLVTDPALDPVPAGIIPQPNLYARKASSGMTVQCDFAKMTATTTVPLCFERILVIDGKEYSAGSLFYRRTANSRSSGSVGSNAHFASPLAPTITTADVILRPDPIYAENFITVNEIWGKEIIFRNVPIERFDLQD